MWKMYVLLCNDGSFYCGITTDTQRRLLEHNGIRPRGSKYTRARRPVVIIYEENHENRSSASKAESMFKKLSRAKKEKYVSYHT